MKGNELNTHYFKQSSTYRVSNKSVLMVTTPTTLTLNIYSIPQEPGKEGPLSPPLPGNNVIIQI